MLQLSILGGGGGNSRGIIGGFRFGYIISLSLWGFFGKIRSSDHVERVQLADILDRLGCLVWSRVLGRVFV